MVTDQNWENYASSDLIDYVRQIEGSPDPFLEKFTKFLKVTAGSELPNHHVKATPLFELCSVSIQRDTILGFDDSLDCALIYGHIKLTGSTGRQHYVFWRGRDNPLIVPLSEDNLSVILQKPELGGPYQLPYDFILDLHLILRDKCQDIDLIKSQRVVNFAREVSFDTKLDIKMSDSATGVDSSVSCVVFQCAVIACVDISVHDIGTGDSGRYTRVGGTISASFKAADGCLNHVLYDSPQSQLVDLKSPLKMKEFSLAVPAYATLQIQTRLEICDEVLINSYGSLEFEAQDVSFGVSEKEISGEKYRVLVRVVWKHALDFFPDDLFCYLRDVEGASSEEDEELDECGEHRFEEWEDITSEGRPLHKRKRIQPWSVLPRSRVISSLPKDLVEVFSVSVCSYDASCAACLYGTIEAYDNRHEAFMIFNTHETNPYVLHPYEVLPIGDIGRCLKGSYFGLDVNLKDGSDREVSKGNVNQSDMTSTGLHDRRICSVVRGKEGFTAVHYTIFSDAVQARLKIVFEGIRDGSVFQVYGSIRTRYSSYRYDTYHDKEYYQSTLFEKGVKKAFRETDELESVKVYDDMEVPLSKYVVAVPCNASLIVEANLFVTREGASPLEIFSLKGKAKFKAKPSTFSGRRGKHGAKGKKPKNISKKIGEKLKLQVFVEWVGLV